MNHRLPNLRSTTQLVGLVLSKQTPCFVLALCVLATLMVGCNGDGLVQVSGQVTLDGNPVPAGRIEFFPESGRPSVGELDSEGNYQLTTFKSRDGAKPGKYVVTVTAREESTGGPQYQSMEDELNGVQIRSEQADESKPVWLVPPKYGIRATSGLTADVDGSEAINFELSSRPVPSGN